jgi:hypothetical protein
MPTPPLKRRGALRKAAPWGWGALEFVFFLFVTRVKNQRDAALPLRFDFANEKLIESLRHPPGKLHGSEPIRLRRSNRQFLKFARRKQDIHPESSRLILPRVSLLFRGHARPRKLGKLGKLGTDGTFSGIWSASFLCSLPIIPSHLVIPLQDSRKPFNSQSLKFTIDIRQELWYRFLCYPKQFSPVIRANPFVSIFLQTLGRRQKTQLLWNQANTDSFPKTPGVGVPQKSRLWNQQHPGSFF